MGGGFQTLNDVWNIFITYHCQTKKMAGYELCGHSTFFAEDDAHTLIEEKVPLSQFQLRIPIY